MSCKVKNDGLWVFILSNVCLFNLSITSAKKKLLLLLLLQNKCMHCLNVLLMSLSIDFDTGSKLLLL